jgi:hypothetical protein
MQNTIYIRDELVLEAHPEGPYILLRREGESGTAFGSAPQRSALPNRCTVLDGGGGGCEW